MFSRRVFIDSRHPRQTPLQIGEHVLERFGPLFVRIKLTPNTVTRRVLVFEFVAVDAIGHGELWVHRLNRLLELIQTVEESDHALVELVVPVEVVLVALEAIHGQLIARLVAACVLDDLYVGKATEGNQAIPLKVQLYFASQTIQQQIDLAQSRVNFFPFYGRARQTT